MKLRLEPGSIRFRVSDDEVEALARSGLLEERIPLGENLSFVMRVAAVAGDFRLIPESYGLTLEVPIGEIGEWAGTRKLEIERSMPWPAGQVLISLEKDLARKPK